MRLSCGFMNGVFWFIVGLQLLLVTPARAFGGLRTEIDSRSLDLLVLTRLTAWRIVLGKWTSLMVQALLLVIALRSNDDDVEFEDADDQTVTNPEIVR